MSAPGGRSPGPGEGHGSQAAAIALLQAGATHGVARVERIDTHASLVFLAGARAIKLKRAVRYPYLDYGTPERRKAMCEAEVTINRRTAPDLYLGIAPIVRRADGTLALGELDPLLHEQASSDRARPKRPGREGQGQGDGDGEEAEDWVVVMRRFASDDLMLARAEAGALDGALADAIADEIARFHAGAEAVDAVDYGARMAAIARRSLHEIESRPDRFPQRRVEALAAATEGQLAEHGGALDVRGAGGDVRRCHGDLHLGNIVMWAGRPTLFDGIEFDPGLAEIDVLYDVAFLLMDLVHRGLLEPANRILSRYLAMRQDYSGLHLLALYGSMRAAVRAKVAASLAAMEETSGTPVAAAVRAGRDAVEYLDTAIGFLAPAELRCIVIGGVSGSGKSTLAAQLAPEIGASPGAIVLRSDVVRKVMNGVAPEERLPEAAYGPEASERVYKALIDRAAEVLSAGRSVVVDAVFGDRDRSEALRAVAASSGAAFNAVWLTASPDALIARVSHRRGDASDAGADVVRSQLRHMPRSLVAEGPAAPGWTLLAADGPPSEVLKAARAILSRESGQSRVDRRAGGASDPAAQAGG